MGQRFGTILAIALLLIAALCFIAWRRSAPRRALGAQSIGVIPLTPTFQGSRGGPRPGLVGGMTSEPILYASLATQIGPYTVSIRQMRSEGDVLTQRGPFNRIIDGNAFYLFVQVLANGDALARCKLEHRSLRAVDDTGSQVHCSPYPDELEPIHLPGGRAFMARMVGASPDALALKWLEGSLRVTGEDGVNLLRFRIESLPLPRGPRIFGRAVPRVAMGARGAGIPPGLFVATGAAGVSQAKATLPVDLPRDFSPQLLMLVPGLPAKIGVPMPADPSPITLRARLGQMGMIYLDVVHGGYRWSGKMWDNDLVFVALPQEPGKSRRAVAFRLSRERYPSERAEATFPTFPSVEGRPGGAIESGVFVGSLPFGRGTLSVALWQRQENGSWAGPRTTLVPVRTDGSLVIPNLAPGAYKMERAASGLIPALPRTEPPCSIDAYLAARFGVKNGKWAGETIDGIVVRPGQKTHIRNLDWMPRPPSPSLSAAR